jgi:hypothetical protein
LLARAAVMPTITSALIRSLRLIGIRLAVSPLPLLYS